MIRWENAPGPYEVVFSTREGGVSEGPWSSLNLGRMTGDEPERVDENRRRVCAEAGADPDALALNYQCHSADVLRARPAARDDRADGLWTDEPGLPVLALSADCLPIALARANGDRPALAVLHAGWRGLLAGIVRRLAADSLASEWQSSHSSLTVFALRLCSWPMKCQRKASPWRACLASRSWALFSPTTSIPASRNRTRSSTATYLVAATTVTSGPSSARIRS